MLVHERLAKDRIMRAIQATKASVYQPAGDLSIDVYKSDEPLPFSERFQGRHLTLGVGDKWGDLWDCGWFHFTGRVPELPENASYPVLVIDVSGEGLIVDNDGNPLRGITNVSSEFDTTLGVPGKRVFLLGRDRCGSEIDIWMDAGCNDLFGNYKGDGRILQAEVAFCDELARQLYYDFAVLYDLLNSLPEDSARRASIFFSLHEAATRVQEHSRESSQAAREILASELNKKGGDPSLSFTAIGHSHLDLAWLWPIRETKRKVARTFATALELMDRYPDYIFGASQAQLYQWVKDLYPALYQRIKERVRQGRWETQGPMWVESDTNIVGGESLVRQFLYGKQFFEAEFGEDIRVLWLPDVFGYSAALPQLMKKSGVDFFMTQKLSWNDFNKFPHHTFKWRGLDGSEVLAHMLPEETYNSPASPSGVMRAEKNYSDKGVCPEALILYGIGDGGGGPGPGHMERIARLKDLNGLCPVTQGKSADFFKRIAKYQERCQTWSGELYLERHQGTYTTQAQTKYYNRKLESALREAEYICAVASAAGFAYPRERIDAIWKEVLLYQFHDILPGSSIKRVYDECVPRYQEMLRETQAITEEAYRYFAESRSLADFTAFNSLSFPRREFVQSGGQWYSADIPAMGWHTFSRQDAFKGGSLVADSTRLENDRLLLEFAADGRIRSIWHKELRRQVLKGPSNGLAVFDDAGDAWDIEFYYAEKAPEMMALASSKAYVDGPYAVMVQEYVHGETTVTQRIQLADGSDRIDFSTTVNWKETHKMLRTLFDLAVQTDAVSCGIQFGNIKRPLCRNTQWDFAKFEICAQKWADLSEQSFGVALLNDCKYGHSVSNGQLSLNLLRSPNYPGVDADIGTHSFQYSLYPHSGNESAARVWEQAEILNNPVRLFGGTVADSVSTKSLITLDNREVVLETVKRGENGNSVILRLYEAAGNHGRVRVKLDERLCPKTISLVNLMERADGADCETGPVEWDGESFELTFGPYEIKTVALNF